MDSLMRIDLPPPAATNLKDYNNRLSTFNVCKNIMVSEKKTLANMGFVYSIKSCYKCVYCGFNLQKLNYKLLKYHTYSLCSRSLYLLKTNETLRKESFVKFKTARLRYKLNGHMLAENGFFFYGRNNEICCSNCGIVIVKLNPNDSIIKLHKTFSKNCDFINLLVSKQSSKPSAPTLYEINDANVNDEPWANKLYPDLNDVSIPNLMTNVVVKDSNKTCVICLDREPQICFNPCGHICCCAVCAVKCKLCCICRVKIQSKIKVYHN
ncbi:inhibitor of apoptosis protein 2 [Adoxophyes honmai nucleopolyhedrovirus]|uniref:Inhibitor of apoptosis protein 2 n=1 Tax=Adoxophyes honmai nucleopolyhedrovirus TaxID=224399 RepID=Q80LP3_NPVAH|nr:inhibitor of apoptosis protein 2 [Adoxophyes honmai nucleopolyhedrovirus]BAC67304.1 inhibitor of apoptosis protein 2 [Adoxophyes honmai nucleopolyhedrovirus]